MKSCTTALKSLLIIFNIAYCVFAVALIFIGGFVLYRLKDYKINDFQFATILLISVGCVTFFFAILGVCGAIQESQCMLVTYTLVVSVVLIVEIIFGMLTLLHRDQIEKIVQKVFVEPIQEDITNNGTMLNVFEKKFDCCGINDVSRCINETCLMTPSNCENATNCTNGTSSCSSALIQSLNLYSRLLGIAFLSTAIIQLPLILLTCFLFNSGSLKHKRYATSFNLLGQLGGRNWNLPNTSMQNSYIPAPSTVSFSTE